MDRIDKYILRFTDKVEQSKSTESRYYNVNNHILRISDHIALSAKSAEWTIVFDSSNPDNYVLYDPETYHLSVMDYEEAKTFVKSWVLMSKTACKKGKTINDSVGLTGMIFSLIEKLNCQESKKKSLNDLIDLTKLTKSQIEQVQKMILDNNIIINNVQDQIHENPRVLQMSDFSKKQQNIIKSFIGQAQRQSEEE